MEKQTMIATFDPSNGNKLAEYATHGPEEIQTILRHSREEFFLWKRSSLDDRAHALRAIGTALQTEKYSLAGLIRAEMGKLEGEALAEIEKCAAASLYYAENISDLLGPIPVPTEAKKSYVSFEPLGPVLAIMPWNFPFWQVVRCAAPAIAAGNSVILKHAGNVTGCALALERLFRTATGRDHLFRTVLLSGKEALDLIRRPEIAAVSLTGSTEVGRLVGAAAGSALKKCVLELGGSDAYVILKDANLEKAAKTCAASRLINAGQSCIAAKRFIVEAPVLRKFTELFIKEINSKTLAPLARNDLRLQLQEQVERSVKQGAQLLAGGKIPSGHGFYYPATVLANIKPGNCAFEEELFGPVAAIVEAKNEEEAIQLANQSEFGLGAAVFTEDEKKAEFICQSELEAGSCFANALVRSDSRLPFGGIKNSGYGRELSVFGIREFTNIKTIYLD